MELKNPFVYFQSLQDFDYKKVLDYMLIGFCSSSLFKSAKICNTFLQDAASVLPYFKFCCSIILLRA